MAKSLAELQLAFKAQYLEDEQQESKAKPTIEAEEAASKIVMKEQLEDQTKAIKQNVEKEQREVKKINSKTQELAEEMKLIEGKKQRRAAVLSDMIFYGTLVLIVVFAILFSRGAMGNETLGGFRMYEVLTTSMESVYPRGSLILIKQTDASELVVGDDIAFAGGGNDLITHRIVEIEENHEATGKRAFVTKGVDNAVADKEPVLAESVVGRVIKGIPKLGATLRWVGENLWIAVVFFFLLIATSFLLKKLWRKSKEIAGEDEEEQGAEKQLIDNKKEKRLFRLKRVANDLKQKQ